MVGHWQKGSTSESWMVSGDALFGIGLGIRDGRTEFFEVMVIEAGAIEPAGESSAGLTFTAMPNGQRAVTFTARSLSGQVVTFVSPDNPFPKDITYRRDGGGLAVELRGEDRPDRSFVYAPGTMESSALLEQADKQFAADSAVRGADAWAEVFAPDGAMWTRNGGLIQGPDAIRATMVPVFGGGASGLEWQPTVSGMSPRGDLGFTVGRYRLGRMRDGGATDTLQTGTYVTIWRRMPDGSWRVAFDTGVPDREVEGQ